MANSDVKVREIRLLEGYSRAYNGFMTSTIDMTYKFNATLTQKDGEARDQNRRIRDTCELIRQRYIQAKNALEYSQKQRPVNERELEQRQMEVEKFKKLYEKAQKYEESGKKLFDNVHAEIERVQYMNRRFRTKLEKSKDDGDNFLKKAISTLNSYKEANG